MADFDAIRHALTVARERGFAEVTLESEDLEFKAVLEPQKAKSSSKPSSAAGSAESDEDAGPVLADITANLVGYFAAGHVPLAVGAAISAGDIIATISQLGIVNEVESKVSGEIVEVLVEENQPVMFGQVLARVKE